MPKVTGGEGQNKNQDLYKNLCSVNLTSAQEALSIGFRLYLFWLNWVLLCSSLWRSMLQVLG